MSKYGVPVNFRDWGKTRREITTTTTNNGGSLASSSRPAASLLAYPRRRPSPPEGGVGAPLPSARRRPRRRRGGCRLRAVRRDRRGAGSRNVGRDIIAAAAALEVPTTGVERGGGGRRDPTGVPTTARCPPAQGRVRHAPPDGDATARPSRPTLDLAREHPIAPQVMLPPFVKLFEHHVPVEAADVGESRPDVGAQPVESPPRD